MLLYTEISERNRQLWVESSIWKLRTFSFIQYDTEGPVRMGHRNNLSYFCHSMICPLQIFGVMPALIHQARLEHLCITSVISCIQ